MRWTLHAKVYDVVGGRRIQVRTHSLPVSKRLRSLDPDHIDTLISVKVSGSPIIEYRRHIDI